jgi:EpsI family protein
MSSRCSRKSVIITAIAAAFLLLVFGAAHRALARLLAIPVNPVPIGSKALADLPMRIGDWTGEDVSLDDAIVRGTDSDAHISRRYARRGGSESVSLYIACGRQVSRVMAHRPEICYDRAGWTLLSSRSTELPMSGGPQLPCDVLRFSRDKPESRGVIVLHYWIADGRWLGRVSHLDSNILHILRRVDYAAHVQISASTTVYDPEAGAKCAADFAADSAGPIARLFQDIDRDRRSGMPGPGAGGE